MDKDYLILRRGSASQPSGEWSDDDFDVLADGIVVGRIFKSAAAPVGTPWFADQLRDGFTDARARCGAALGSRQPVSRSVSAERMA